MRKPKLRLFLLAAALIGTALLAAARPAASRCIPDMCWMVDEDTTCCYLEDCSIWCG